MTPESFGKGLKLERVLDQLTEPMMVLDRSGRAVFFNKAITQYEALTGKSFVKGADVLDLVSAERRKIVSGILDDIRENKIPQTVEAQYEDKAGRSVYFEVIYSPILNSENELSNICIIAHDITHQKTFERKTIQILQELSGLIENANALIFSVDSREYITEWNKLSAQVTGFEKSDTLAEKIGNFIDKTSYEKLATLLTTVLKGKSASNFELLVKSKKSERLLTVLVNATPKLNSAGNAVGVMFVGQDITELSSYRSSLEQMVQDRTTELKEALKKEKELVDIKNRFISMASHEFKIPLSTISSATHSIKLNPNLREEDHEKVKRIEGSVGRMKDLLEDILTVEKSEYEKLKPSIHTFDLIHLLKEIMEEVLAGTRHTHRINSSFPHPSINITSDDKLLRNVFVNLLSNAVKFSPDNLSIDLSVSLTEKTVDIEVKDQGIGIPKEDMERIFVPFNRGSNTKNIKGTGLGLSIVKKAIETLDGVFELASVPQKGTTVTVKLKR